MPVVGFAAEAPDSPKASFSLGKITVSRRFLVETSSVLDGPIVVGLAPGLPVLFEPYIFGFEGIPVVLCRSITPSRLAPNSLFWQVDCEYESPDPKDPQHGGGGGSGGGSGDGGTGDKDGSAGGGVETAQEFANPEVMIPEIELHFTTHREVAYQGFDISGNAVPIIASNGEVYIPAPEKDSSILELRITRNESLLTPYPALALAYQDHVNSDTFWGASAGTVKCQSITVQRMQKNYPDGSFIAYLRTTYVFQFKASWDLQILDKGTWYWGGASFNKKIKFKSDDGQNIEGLLDGTGKALATGATPVFQTVKLYPRAAFGNLNLPQNFTQVQ